MNTQERINRAFSSIHASDNVLENVYDMAKHSKEKTKVIPIMLVGMVLLSTIVFAATHFHLSEKVLQIDEKELSPQMQESVTIIKENNAISGRENQYVGGFLISYPFEYNKNAYTVSEYAHKGIDIVAEKGTKVLAVCDGMVESAKFSAEYGNYITIKHEDGYETVYAHLQEMYVSKGQKVLVGETIGTVGATGMATGPHLHFELHYQGEAVNPLEYMGE